MFWRTKIYVVGVVEVEKNYDFYISEAEIGEILYSELIDLGYVPESDEILDLAEIVFEMFVTLLMSLGTQVALGEDEE